MSDCPVCGYNRLPFPPSDFHICPCCGTEFGNDDFQTSHDALRERWIALGAPWFSTATPPPPGWDWLTQLYNAGKVVVRLKGSEVQIKRLQVEKTGRFEYSFRAA